MTSWVVTPRRAIFAGIEPDAHAVVARAEYHHLADSVHSRQRVVHVQRGEVGQEQVVVARIVRTDRHRQQDLRLTLGHRDPLLQHLLRQLALGDGDLVLHVHRGDVLVGADLEGHGQRVAAVVGALGVHVNHVRHAVDLLLDRRSDGLLDGGGVGARESGRDDDGRRRDLREAGDRQR